MCHSDFIFIVILAVCLNMQFCTARPYEMDDTNSISGNSLGKVNADSSLFEFKLPTDLTDDMIIILNGALNNHVKMITAKLASQNNNPDSDCKLVYDFDTNKMKIMPASSSDHESSVYIMDNERSTFNLRLKARNQDGNQIVDFIFEGDENGPSDVLACKIKDLKDISHIVIEGVDYVENLLFEFPK